MKKSEKIYVAGHSGLVGSALMRQLSSQGFENILTSDRAKLDLCNQSQVESFFKTHRPDYVFIAAGRVGGVYANDTYRAEFLYENNVIQNNLIHYSFLHEVKKLMYFGCSSMYPKLCPQPIKEEYLLSGPLEPTNEPFAIAKLAGWKMCESYSRQYGADFITVIPTNLYGLSQNYTPLNAIVVPSLIRRFHEAKESQLSEVAIWGSGRQARDFLYSDDLADAAIFLMNNYSGSAPVNVGSGSDCAIRELAEIVKDVIGFKGQIGFDSTKPEGVLVKLQDVSRISNMGWKPKVSLPEGIRLCYQDFISHLRDE